MSGFLGKLEQLLDGRKTYLVMVLVGVGAVLQYKGIVIPEFVWVALAALGLGAVRSAINKIKPPPTP